MKLIDRYVSEVGDILPDDGRQDIEKEIRSLIEDRLMDRCEEAGLPEPTEEIAKEVLVEMGPPEEVAKGYLPEVYLIGPRYFFIFTKVMKIVVIAQTIAMTVLFVIRLVMESATNGLSGSEVVNVFLQTLGIFWQAFVTAFAVVVIIFAAIEWSQRKIDLRLKFWSPQHLDEPKLEKVSRTGKVFEIVFILIGLIVFNLYPEWVGFSSMVDGVWQHIPILTENFWKFLPLINIGWGLSFALAFYLVIQGKWEPWSQWVDIGIKMFEMVVLFFILSAAPLVGVSPDVWATTELSNELVVLLQNTVLPITNISIQIALVIALIVSGVELIQKIFKKTRGVPVIEVNI